MSLESILVTAATEIAEKLIDRAAKGQPLVGVPFDRLLKKARWNQIERAALRDAARKRIEGRK